MYDSVKSYSSWFCNWWLLACLPTVATEGRPGSKGLFDTICMIHWYTKDNGRELCHLQLPSVYMISNIITMVVGGRPSQGIPIERGFWIGKLPRSQTIDLYRHQTIGWLCQKKSKMCPVSIGFQHLERSYRSFHLSLEVLSFDIIWPKECDEFGCAKPQPFVDSLGHSDRWCFCHSYTKKAARYVQQN